MGYVRGRVENQIAPALRDARLWQHPVVAGAFDPRDRERLLAAVDSLPRYVDELARAPLGSAHGDASPRNLLRRPGQPTEFVLIDFGFMCTAPLGFDLSQLLLGEIQVGERSPEHLPDLQQRCLTTYLQGLRDERCDVPREVVERNQALIMLIFYAFSAVPLEVMYGLPGPGDPHVIQDRATAARFVLDLVDRTAEPHPS